MYAIIFQLFIEALEFKFLNFPHRKCIYLFICIFIHSFISLFLLIIGLFYTSCLTGSCIIQISWKAYGIK